MLTAWWSMSTPHCGFRGSGMQVPWLNCCCSTIPYPAFRFGCWSLACALCKWDQHRLWLQKRRGQKGVQRSRGWLKAGSVAWGGGGNVSWVSAAVLCSCERKCALFLKILQRVPESFKAHAGTMTFRDAPDFISVKDTDGDWLFKFTVAIGRMLLVSRHPLLVSSYYYHYSFSLLAFLYLGFFVVMEYFMRETVVGLGSLNNSAFWVCVYFGELSGWNI